MKRKPVTEFGEVTEERLERGVAMAAWIVARHGPVYAPIFERLERELAELRAREDPVARARRYLAAHSFEGLKAIA